MNNRPTEDYLKKIFWLSRISDKVTTSSIAAGLQISSASVTEMLKRLSEKGFITYTPYYGVRLTKKGDRTALKVIRRHRLMESFLVSVLGYTWDDVHDEAERMEHVISDELEARIDNYLGHPRYDPHGDPIPTHEGVLEEPSQCCLAELEPGDRAVVSQVVDSKKLLQFIKKMDVGLRSRILVREKESFDGSMKIRVDNKKDHYFSREAARQIFVKRIQS